jgi:signal peptidase II
MTFELLLSAVFVLLADQLAKRFVTGHLAKGQSVLVGGPVTIHYSANPPKSQRFSHNPSFLLLVWGITLVSLIFFTQHGYFFGHPTAQVGLGTALGGATSNLYDRLRRGAVIDFVKVGWWPIFNLADVGICLGATFAIWFMR